MINSNDEISARSRSSLSEADGLAVDRAFEIRGASALSPESAGSGTQIDDPRTQQVLRLLALLDEYPVETDSDESANDDRNLVEATMAMIRGRSRLANSNDRAVSGSGSAALAPSSLRFRNDGDPIFAESAGPSLRINWRDMLSIAAVILLVASVTIPMLDNARMLASRQKCCSNLLGAAVGFSQFADDYNGTMPSVFDEGTVPQGNWLVSHANSANLFDLASKRYVRPQTLSCPGAEETCSDLDDLLAGTNWPKLSKVSYAYQNQFGPYRAKWNNPMGPMAVLSDHSPIVDASANAGSLHADALSPAHGGTLQNILLSDGSVMQSNRPYVGLDNIWLPHDLTVQDGGGAGGTAVRLNGTEFPSSATDSMLIQ